MHAKLGNDPDAVNYRPTSVNRPQCLHKAAFSLGGGSSLRCDIVVGLRGFWVAGIDHFGGIPAPLWRHFGITFWQM